MTGVAFRQEGKRELAAVRRLSLGLKWSATQCSPLATKTSEQEGEQKSREVKPYASAAGESTGEGIAKARENPITIDQYEGANTWGDLKEISVRKLAEGLVRIEKRVVAIEGRMATKEDLEGMATKHDVTKTKLSIVLWNAGVVLAGVAIMAAVTFGILQFALS